MVLPPELPTYNRAVQQNAWHFSDRFGQVAGATSVVQIAAPWSNMSVLMLAGIGFRDNALERRE